MASFSTEFPRAYHVFPLTAARGIFSAGALLAKSHLGPDGEARRTTRDVDVALGFEGFVHLYLPRAGTPFEALPILGAQLAPARRPAVPHACVVMATAALDDDECTVCNWNIAVGRPGVPGVCRGGNWTRGTNPARIAEVWDAFRATGPDIERARGVWVGPKVPVLVGADLSANWRLMKRGRAIAELLLRDRVQLGADAQVHVFSAADARSLAKVAPPPGVTVHVSRFDGYSEVGDPLPAELRSSLDAYLAEGGTPPDIDFDGRRS